MSSGNADALIAHASQRMAREDYVGAIEVLRNALGREPEEAKAHALLAV